MQVMKADEQRTKAANMAGAAQVPFILDSREELDIAITNLLASNNLKRPTNDKGSDVSFPVSDSASDTTDDKGLSHEQLANEACYLAHMALPQLFRQQNLLWMPDLKSAMSGLLPGADQCFVLKIKYNIFLDTLTRKSFFR